ncbi:hypothetical protein [Marinobacter halotolerans]|uniref:hypothetical protein n=1 Tax=Marinobacter halotolerans TaxID=1569211 RepID=UPI0012479377|nr:hypothetical protein [Marinobacter halotolerans]
MLSSLIILLELGLFSLLLLLAFRVLSLNRSEPLVPAVSSEQPRDQFQSASSRVTSGFRDYDAKIPSPGRSSAKHKLDRCELISQLHILASLQERDCKQQGLEIEAAHLAIREYAVCWLYGAACALSRPGSRNADSLAMTVSQFASRKVGIKQPDALVVISTLTRHSTFLACFRSGVEGAEFWQTHHFVPREKSLFDAITSNAFI